MKNKKSFIKLGNAVKKFRNEQNMTIEEFSQKSGLSVYRLLKIENGEVNFGLYDLDKMGKGLGISGLKIIEEADL